VIQQAQQSAVIQSDFSPGDRLINPDLLKGKSSCDECNNQKDVSRDDPQVLRLTISIVSILLVKPSFIVTNTTKMAEAGRNDCRRSTHAEAFRGSAKDRRQ